MTLYWKKAEQIMGLDIEAYRKLKIDETVEDDDGETTSFFINPDFPGRADDIEGGKPYVYDSVFSFRAGSYSGYGAWRRELCKTLGFTSDDDYWYNATPETPFYELINFSDCEGVIGTEISEKLLKDFSDHQEGIDKWESHSPWVHKLYKLWRTAFETASDDGAVKFM